MSDGPEPTITATTTAVTRSTTACLDSVDVFREPVKDSCDGPLGSLLGDGVSFLTFDATNERAFKSRLATFSSGLLWKFFPGELYLAGDSMSIVLDATLDATSTLYEKTSLDFFVLGTPLRKKEIVTDLLSGLRLLHPDVVLSKAAKCYISLWIAGFSRRVNLILVHEQYRRIDDVLPRKVDYTHLESAYDGATIAVTAAAITAMATRTTKCRHRGVNPLHRMYPQLLRNYTVSNYAFKFTELMSACEDYMKAELYTYAGAGNVSALMKYTGIPRDRMYVAVAAHDPLAYFMLFHMQVDDWVGVRHGVANVV